MRRAGYDECMPAERLCTPTSPNNRYANLSPLVSSSEHIVAVSRYVFGSNLQRRFINPLQHACILLEVVNRVRVSDVL